MNNFSYLKRYLRKNHYYDLEEEILTQLESHPNFPSLYAIIDTFNFLEIENLAIKVEKEEFENLPECFIAVVDSDTGKETILAEKLQHKIRIEFSNGFKKTITETEFLTIWTGIVVAIEKNETSSKLRFSVKNNWIAGAFFMLSLFLVLINNGTNLIFASFYYLSAITGLITSIFLIREETGIHNESVSKICNVNEKTSCKAVLSSKGAKIFGDVSLSDISIIYFLSITFLSLFLTFESVFAIYTGLALLSIPVLIYSVCYQYFVLKKWCVLCLGIVGVLLSQLILVLSFWTKYKNSFNAINVVSFVLVFGLMLLCWLKFKTLFKKNIELKKTEVKHNQFKRKSLVFNALLKDSQKIDIDSINDLKAVFIGKYDAPVTIYALLSASCGHCHSAFENIIKLTEKNPNEIKAKLLFNVNIKNENNPNNKVYHQVAHFYFNDGEEKVQDALKDWHIRKMTLEKWTAKWGTTKDFVSEEIIQEQYNWCYDNYLLFAPAIIVNGYVLPKEYEINELSYFLENLIETKKAVL
ncbi:vitamin K epoxide reductase family protein [Flavobacterium branchiicola]|uniref:Vitamin K epoxide reductase family protein n=1 Tax=Flavobacterium branchiicola TaxID=1114875 RepID=A0ABV9P8G6_9FLAO|nr:vitamin K epoxide reductase family protein [Flavobacterium branchiicola]MBS7252938.1 thioredoxin domain-containing protein [Flavobacterium branchiicola]